MKVLTILSTLIITITSCNCQKKATDKALASQSENTEVVGSEKNEKMTTTQTIPVLIYESRSRGYFRKITIENSKIAVQNSSEEKPMVAELSTSEIKMLEEAYNGLNPKELAGFKAPTEKRFYDGAPITNLVVKEGDEIFSTPDFDGGFPPVEIEKLVNTILKIAEKIK